MVQFKNCLNIWTIYVRVCMSAKYTVGWSLYVLAAKMYGVCMYLSTLPRHMPSVIDSTRDQLAAHMLAGPS